MFNKHLKFLTIPLISGLGLQAVDFKTYEKYYSSDSIFYYSSPSSLILIAPDEFKKKYSSSNIFSITDKYLVRCSDCKNPLKAGKDLLQNIPNNEENIKNLINTMTQIQNKITEQEALTQKAKQEYDNSFVAYQNKNDERIPVLSWLEGVRYYKNYTPEQIKQLCNNSQQKINSIKSKISSFYNAAHEAKRAYDRTERRPQTFMQGSYLDVINSKEYKDFMNQLYNEYLDNTKKGDDYKKSHAAILANEQNKVEKYKKYLDIYDEYQNNKTIYEKAQKELKDTQDSLESVKSEIQKDKDANTQINEDYQKQLEVIIYLMKQQQAAITSINTNLKNLNSISTNVSSNTIALNLASNLATNTRLAKLSNPYSIDKNFVAFIKSIQEKALAANSKTNLAQKKNDNPLAFLTQSVYGYDNLRFRYQNNLWGNIGSIAGTSNGINTISGVFSFGYDAWVKNMILGTYASYSYTSNSLANTDSKNQAHNADIGFYARFFAWNNEFDINLGEDFSFNSLSLKDTLINTIIKSDYLTYQTHLDLTYGYVFKLSSSGWFSKPFLGVGYNFGYSNGMKTTDTSNSSMSFSPFQSHFVNIQLGAEFRKYFNDNNSYFYVSPAYYQGILIENTQKIQTQIYDHVFTKSNTDFNKNNNLDNSFLLKIGGEIQINEKVYINASAGMKLGNINQYGMINLGGRWMF